MYPVKCTNVGTSINVEETAFLLEYKMIALKKANALY